jgi:hypothetical protein
MACLAKGAVEMPSSRLSGQQFPEKPRPDTKQTSYFKLVLIKQFARTKQTQNKQGKCADY